MQPVGRDGWPVREGGREGGRTRFEGAVAHDQDIEGIPVVAEGLRNEAWREGGRAGGRRDVW
jgi:hypothetical protein